MELIDMEIIQALREHLDPFISLNEVIEHRIAVVLKENGYG